MTGRYEEPETVRDARPVSPGAVPEPEANPAEPGQWNAETAAPAASSGRAPWQEEAPPDYGDGGDALGQYVEPGTDPEQPHPGTGPNSAQSSVDSMPSCGQHVPAAEPGPQQYTAPPGPYSAQAGPPQPGMYPPQGGPYMPQAQPGAQPPQPNPAQPQPNPAQQQYPFPAQQPPGAMGPGEQPFPQQDLSSAQLLRQTKRPPQSGWRRALYVASGRTINLGESAADLRRRELIGRINQPLHGCYRIAMLSLKGGVGKTTATATLGSTFSSLRGDRVIAVDANPDRGTLGQKIPLETTATVRHLLRDAQRIRKYSDVRSYTSQGPSRLEILASEQDPATSEAFSEDDYRRTVTLLEHFYNVVLTDCGTGLMHSAMKGVLDVADSLVIVSSSSIDGARSASATLDWLDAHGYGDLVSRSVAVINSVRPGSGKVDVDKLTAHFGSRCRAVSRIPFDSHLDEGAEVELERLAAPTRLALLELAATVADDFPHALGRQRTAGM
ncbi:MinD/ParA family ATP-binding protein [Haloactinomyces albus]|uniref:MinD-like ATPase involved in chromosome partitioning or flagellar assembly n=1 Tax=Haloactinomyces albus TaxID=1352928 RepID=A0AAE3ZEL2_9ACTN|nr:AAA family ATPase [Haloactinomyces albus]MDR7302375.1 MinD-like ATPase involved in chromosome partitioning or flagellar assembly [Haloactinomyces albus]